MKGDTIIVDALAICHAAKHAMKNYELTKDEVRTEIIFLFIRKIMALANQIGSNKFVFAWDSKKSYRKKLCPTYKDQRRADLTLQEQIINKIAFDQFAVIRCDVIPQLGFANNFIQTGYEADDIIASLVQNRKEPFVIVSTDNDLLQLLSPNVFMYSPATKRRTFYSDFVKQWGIEPPKWAYVKALAGCSSDNVIGLKGIGEKSACRYLSGSLGKKTKAFNLIQENYEAMCKQNLHLVKLPMKFDGLPPVKQFKLKPDNLSLKKLIHVCNQFGFESLLKPDNLKRWAETMETE